MRNADMALYRAKSDGGGVHRFFEREMDRQAQKRRDMERDLRRAFANGEFELHYQPLVDIAANRISGFESLLRWRKSDKGMISPADFIPVAEDIGLIVQLGEWVLREACTEAMNWPKDVKVAVNLSPVQFRAPRFPATLRAIAEEEGVTPSQLELEITESLFIEHGSLCSSAVQELRRDGFRIVLDDFGTGYSSLSCLRRFPVDKIKLDRSFIDIAARDQSVAIIRAAVTLGHAMDLEVVAEGISCAEEEQIALEAGCDGLQGHLYAPAMPASGIGAFLAAAERSTSISDAA
jgi:EAL domain-containing protein (putative c-di-GMP-specific phosphodiesterase class I)